MSLLMTKIDKKLSKSLETYLEDLNTKLAAEVAFEQPVIDEICSTAAQCRKALNDAIDEIATEKKRLAEDVFADRIVSDVFDSIRGDETAFPQRVYENHDALSASYRTGQSSLDAFEQDLHREWEEVASMAVYKRSGFVVLARRKMKSIVAELEKVRGRGVEESRMLEGEIRGMQEMLTMKDELEEATEEFYDAKQDW